MKDSQKRGKSKFPIRKWAKKKWFLVFVNSERFGQ